MRKREKTSHLRYEKEYNCGSRHELVMISKALAGYVRSILYACGFKMLLDFKSFFVVLFII
jgi:hypothetical protein